MRNKAYKSTLYRGNRCTKVAVFFDSKVCEVAFLVQEMLVFFET